MTKVFALLVGGILVTIMANNASSKKPEPVAEVKQQVVDETETPLPTIRGMYCNTPCIGSFAPDRHLGELAALVIFRKQCFSGSPEEQVEQQGAALVDYRFSIAWDEWNSTPADMKKTALTHELAAIDARRQKYGNQYGGLKWFCNIMSNHINKGDYRSLEVK